MKTQLNMKPKKKHNIPSAVNIQLMEKKNPWSMSNQENFKKFFYLLGFLAFLLYANTFWNGYNIDDFLVTQNHPLTTLGLSSIGEIFSQPYYKDEMGVAFGYRPIVLLSYAFEHQFFGVNPSVSHFFNALFYALCVMLLFKLLNSWTSQKHMPFALVAALLFAVHPIHTEAVASLKNRDELLAFLFIMLTGLLLYKFIVKEKLHWLLLALLTFIVALLSKKSVYPVVFIYSFSLLLLFPLTFKRFILIAITLILPAALIASDLNWTRAILLVALPLAALLLTYVIKYLLENGLPKRAKILFNQYGKKFLITSGIAISTFIFLYFHLYYFFIVSIILIGFLLWDSEKWGLAAFLIAACIFLFVTDNSIFLYFLLFYIFFYFFYLKNNHSFSFKKIWIPIALGIPLILSYYFYSSDIPLLNVFIFSTILAFFNFFVFKNFKIAFIAIVLNLIIIYFLKDKINVTNTLILNIGIYLKLIFDYLKWKRLQIFTPIVSILILIFVSFPQEFHFFQPENITSTSVSTNSVSTVTQNSENVYYVLGSELSENSKTIKEGRQLEQTENPLVMPHSFWEKIATGWYVLGVYLKLMLIPINLSFYYGYSEIRIVDFSNIWGWLSILTHVFLFGLAIYFFFSSRRKKVVNQLFIIGFIWYFLSILLFSNWVELLAGGVGERLAFLASGGFCIMISSVIFMIKPDFILKSKQVSSAVFLIAVLFFSWQTINRNFKWKDPYTLVNNDIQHLKKSAHAHYIYAKLLMLKAVENGQNAAQENIELETKALKYLNDALAIDTNYYNAVLDKGMLALNLGQEDTAIVALQRATDIYSNILKPYPQLCALYFKKADFPRLLNTAETYHSLDKDNIEAKFYLYKALMGVGKNEEALSLLQKTIEEHPDLPELKDELNDYYQMYHRNE